MGKTTPSKVELIAWAAQLNGTDQEIILSFLAHKINEARCEGLQLNALSEKLISDITLALTGIPINKANYFAYKQSGLDILSEISSRLSCDVYKPLQCEVGMRNGVLVLKAEKHGPVAAMQQLIKNSTSEGAIKAYYRTWLACGWSVGAERNWIQPELLSWLVSNNIYPAIPISHTCPTKIRRVFAELKQLVSNLHNNDVDAYSMETWVNEQLLAFCNRELRVSAQKSRGWLSQPKWIPQIEYRDKISAGSRLTPYLYCRFVENGLSKIGKADNSIRFRKDSLGVVVCMKRDKNSDLAKCEHIVFTELRSRGVVPIGGKYEHFAASLKDLSCLMLEVCSSNAYLRSNIIAVTATTNHRK